MHKAPHAQQSLPLPQQPPCPAEVDREVQRLLASRPYWRSRYGAQVLSDPERLALLRGCALRALERRRGLKQPTTQA